MKSLDMEARQSALVSVIHKALANVLGIINPNDLSIDIPFTVCNVLDVLFVLFREISYLRP